MWRNKVPFLKRSWPFLVLFLGILIFFKDVLLLKKYFWEDILSLAYPSLTYLATTLRSGCIPFWTPYIFSGMPFMADVQSQIFYPINWILPFFAESGTLPFLAVEIQVIFHILLGGFFTYIYTREIKLSNFGALISAFTFMLSGFLITHSIHLYVINVFIWLPLILFFLHKALTSRKYIYGVLGGVFFGISILGGSPQFTLYISYFLVLYTLFYVLSKTKRPRRIRETVPTKGKQQRSPTEIKKKGYKYLFIGLIVILIGYGISAIQYLPTYEYSKYTVRKGMSYEESAVSSLAPSQLITLLIPKFFGSSTGMRTDSVPFWGGEANYHTFWETCIYIGILPLVFVFFAFRKKRKKLVWLFGGMAILSLLAAMGKNTYFYKFIYYILPGFNNFRCPGRFSGIFSFSMAVLAGFGVDEFFRDKKHKFPKCLIAFTALIVLFWILFYSGVFKGIISKHTKSTENYTNILKQYNIFIFFLLSSLTIILLQAKSILRPNILKSICVVIIFADLYIFGHSFNASNKNPYEAYAYTPLIRLLQRKRETEHFRVNMRKGGYMLLQKNAGNIYRVELIEGYTSLKLRRYRDFFGIPFERALALLNVKYRIAIDKKAGKIGLRENLNYLPRAFVVSDYIVAANENEVLEILSDRDFDYQNKIVLEEKPDIDLSGVKKQDFHSRIDIHRDKSEPNRVSLDLSTDVPAGFLVFSDIYYPAWKAYVNGKRTKIYCADYILRAICIGKGESKVELVYDSTTYKIGLIISLLTILFVIVSLVPHIKKRRISSAK